MSIGMFKRVPHVMSVLLMSIVVAMYISVTPENLGQMRLLQQRSDLLSLKGPCHQQP